MSIKKITIAVEIDKEKYIQLLMSKIKFVENSRVATGGMMSNPLLLIEFQGLEENYHEKGYIKTFFSEWSGDNYFTIKNPNGATFKTFDEFLQSQNKKDEFEYNEIN